MDYFLTKKIELGDLILSYLEASLMLTSFLELDSMIFYLLLAFLIL